MSSAAPSLTPAPTSGFPQLSSLAEAFTVATGFDLKTLAQETYPGEMWTAPDNPGVGTTPGNRIIALGSPTAGQAAIAQPAAARLATELDGFLRDYHASQRALWEREAELAAGIPVRAQTDEEEHLAVRLRGVLRSGAESLGCDAASLYLLDEGTSELKLRSAWGLPTQALRLPPRPLAGALADLEAMLGHAVALESPALLNAWSAPADVPCQAALCVPVSTATLPLGTTWFYSGQPRTFSTQQTGIAEIVAGRIASDLERTMLLQQAASTIVAARDRDGGQISTPPKTIQSPCLANWDLSGAVQQADGAGGAFFDWWTNRRGQIYFAVGQAGAGGPDAALSAARITAALRAHTDHLSRPGTILGKVNQAIWQRGTGEDFAKVFFGAIESTGRTVQYAVAGTFANLIAGGKQPRRLLATGNDLGLDPQRKWPTRSLTLQPAEELVLCTLGITAEPNATLVTGTTQGSQRAESLLPQDAAAQLHDRALLALKRHSVRTAPPKSVSQAVKKSKAKRPKPPTKARAKPAKPAKRTVKPRSRGRPVPKRPKR